MLMCSVASYAENIVIDADKLTEAQKAELKAQSARLSADNEANKTASLTDIAKDPSKAASMAASFGSSLAIAAKGFAEALGIAAHELNININDFLNTPAGKLTVVIIIWKVFGTSLLHILVLATILTTGFSMSRVIYLRLFVKEIQYVDRIWFWGLFTTTKKIRVMKTLKDITAESNDGWVLVMLLIVAITVVLFAIAA